MHELSLGAVIAEIQRRQGLDSQPKLARFLQVTEKTIANWVHERNYPDECKTCLLAELSGVDVGVLAAYCAAGRASTPEGRATWLRVLRQLQRTANPAVAGAMESGAEEDGQCWLGGR